MSEADFTSHCLKTDSDLEQYLELLRKVWSDDVGEAKLAKKLSAGALICPHSKSAGMETYVDRPSSDVSKHAHGCYADCFHDLFLHERISSNFHQPIFLRTLGNDWKTFTTRGVARSFSRPHCQAFQHSIRDFSLSPDKFLFRSNVRANLNAFDNNHQQRR